MVNDEQTRNWNGASGQYWAAHDDRYDAMLAPFDAPLLAAAGITAADDVLDVGCGCGGTSRLAAGTAGSVLGVDLSQAMLERATTLTAAAGLRNVRFERADAQVHPFEDGGFDVVLSRLGVMFFDDPVAAFANLGRALRPAGRIAFVCWQAHELNAYRTVPAAAIAPYLPPPQPPPPGEPGPFAFADADRVRDLLLGAGCTDIRIDGIAERLRAGGDAADAAGFLRHLPSFEEVLGAVDADVAEEAAGALQRELAAHETAQGVFLDSAAWLVSARRGAPPPRGSQ